ncbi:monofunctional biosynthetic peptidoglycan transglycosylase [Pontivivens insulae]|uniref:Biosynthetic peptidoglycan transglycosylase n=1 Tax=Pontivivens insulae TaxID=1639689 RepID=A0A2R8A819_9RHOB|nr:monofunctional biosynthetic peptidoglycan transglycosylase [Pontivivens insulae]RED18474.1 monofunctional biosynthetic peptidoglycan transglycosylase [Pontivivens insulae]SPF28372.1 Biosynthetic peptidoglycan transglycosylase [Pontivivens insulae]
MLRAGASGGDILTKKKFRPLRWLFRWWVRIVFLCTVAGFLLVGAGRWAIPPITHTQWAEQQRLGGIARTWLPLDKTGEMAAAVIAAEDVEFCNHAGFDIDAIRDALGDGRRRGASTLSQQVAKNVYLWQDASWLRKGLEAAITAVIELTWPKSRIIEVYLNVAETGTGVFGAEAAAQHWFGVRARDLSAQQAAYIAAILPNPRGRSANPQSNFIAERGRAIYGGMRIIARDGRLDCLTEG